MHNIFVYGTLKRNFVATGLNRFPEAKYVAEAITKDASYSLHDLGNFPATLIEGDNHIKGEIWSVNDEIMKYLDRYEGYPSLFDRTQIETSQGKAWMYYMRSVLDFNSKKVNPDENNIVQWLDK